MCRRTKHQLVCSTYCSRTKPTAQTNAAIRAANVTTFNNQSKGYKFHQAVNKSTAKCFCFAKTTMPTHHPKQIKIT